MSISLSNAINQASKRPRTAIELDKTSGVRASVDGTREVLIVAQMLSTGTAAAGTPMTITRALDGALYFGAGSIADIACRAALLANPNCILSCVGIADAGVKATATVTFATTATGGTEFRMRVRGIEIVTEIALNDTPTVIGDNFVATLLAVDAKTPLGVTAINVAGVVTLTVRGGGTIGNSIQLRLSGQLGTGFAAFVATTAALSGAAMGSVVAGTGSVSPATAFAGAIGKRYPIYVATLDDSSFGTAFRAQTDSESSPENDHGCIFTQAINSTMSAATTLALAVNAQRGVLGAIHGSESWAPEIAAALGATMASESSPTKPYNTLILNGILPPTTVVTNWTKLEEDGLLNNGVTPLVVQGGQVAIERAVSTNVKDTAGNYDYSFLDITKYLAFDYTRDALTAMFDRNYGRSRWADSDPDGLLPPDVATPAKVIIDMYNTLKDLEALGVVQNVDALRDQLDCQKVGTNCQFAVPAAFVDGMHEKLGKVVYFNAPLAEQG